MFVPLLLLLAATPVTAPPADPATGAELIQQMHARYAGRWYRTLTFVQKTTHPDGSVETWYEAAAIPGSLRIDIAPLSARNELLFRADSIYRYANGELKMGRPLVHSLLLLGFDVYGQPPERTIASLTALGYDLTKVHADTWQGRKVWVVGASAGDTVTKQFWIDQERLVFVRGLAPHPQKPGVHTEVQFNKYVELGQGWIETEVLFLEDGTITTREEYRDMRADPTPPVDPVIFLPGAYVAPGWVTE